MPKKKRKSKSPRGQKQPRDPLGRYRSWGTAACEPAGRASNKELKELASEKSATQQGDQAIEYMRHARERRLNQTMPDELRSEINPDLVLAGIMVALDPRSVEAPWLPPLPLFADIEGSSNELSLDKRLSLVGERLIPPLLDMQRARDIGDHEREAEAQKRFLEALLDALPKSQSPAWGKALEGLTSGAHPIAKGIVATNLILGTAIGVGHTPAQAYDQLRQDAHVVSVEQGSTWHTGAGDDNHPQQIEMSSVPHSRPSMSAPPDPDPPQDDRPPEMTRPQERPWWSDVGERFTTSGYRPAPADALEALTATGIEAYEVRVANPARFGGAGPLYGLGWGLYQSLLPDETHGSERVFVADDGTQTLFGTPVLDVVIGLDTTPDEARAREANAGVEPAPEVRDRKMVRARWGHRGLSRLFRTSR